MSNLNKCIGAFKVISLGTISFGAYCILTGNREFYKNFLYPYVFCYLEAERTHKLAALVLKYKLFLPVEVTRFSNLKTCLWNIDFDHPIGLAAGFDKDGELIDGVSNLGFTLIEIGSVTPLAQPGNPKPRLFRIIGDKALLNRYGFNSAGHEKVRQNIIAWRSRQRKSLKYSPHYEHGYPDSRNMINENFWVADKPHFFFRFKMPKPVILGVNLGKNKLSQDSINDYVEGIKCFGLVSDYLVVNISSPNTPGLRTLQEGEHLSSLVEKITEARDNLDRLRKPPLLLKVSPDLSDDQIAHVSQVVMNSKNNSKTRVNRFAPNGIDGLIVTNTTISRPSSNDIYEKLGPGGLSGKPLSHLSTDCIKKYYKLLKGSVPIIGVGGIFDGKDAYEKIKAGATLVQVYTGFVYEGPSIVSHITAELSRLVSCDGYSSIQEAVGSDCK